MVLWLKLRGRPNKIIVAILNFMGERGNEMQYISTRGNKESFTAAEAIIKGIAADGGLFVPTEIPHIDRGFIKNLLELDYQQRAVQVLSQFLTDYTQEELADCVNSAYGDNKFDTKAVAPTINFGAGNEVLELWHGPTSAFKDMALQLLPQLMSTALKKTGEKSNIVILVATSGDTGKAALEGFKNVPQIRIMVFYPEEGVSRIQRQQMVTQEGSNVSVVAVRGNFDDAQSGVKEIFNNTALSQALASANIQLSSANSINWGRLVPQIVYYFSAYADLVNSAKINIGEAVNFVVPTGNFGNILAAWYAKEMGLPINKLICASNSNNVLTDFLQTGEYDRNREFYKTNTPSMDILISSNLERLLYHMTNAPVSIKTWMQELSDNGKYKIDAAILEKIKETFWADWAADDKTCAVIHRVYEKYQYVMDTHTAVAWAVAENYQQATNDKTPLVVVSTASPYKFNESVLQALQITTPADADAFVLLDEMEKINAVKAPAGLAKLRTAAVIHSGVCDKTEMKAHVTRFSAQVLS